MLGKSLNFIGVVLTHLIICGVASAGDGSAWGGSPVGKCFPNVNEFLIAEFGTQYKSDENINLITTAIGKQFVWVIDMTPGTNVTHTNRSRAKW